MLDILVRPYPTRTAGTPVSYGYKPRSGKFWLHYLPDLQAGDSTVIYIPERSYPKGWSFGKHAPEEGSWRWEEQERKLYIAPAGRTGIQKLEIVAGAT